MHSSKYGWLEESDTLPDKIAHLFSLIQDNEVDHLGSYLESSEFSEGNAFLRWESYKEDIGMPLTNGKSVHMCDLSPLNVAIKSKSFGSVKLLLERYSNSFREYF